MITAMVGGRHTEAQREQARARERLAVARRQTTRVRAITGALRDARRHNGFAESVEQLWRSRA